MKPYFVVVDSFIFENSQITILPSPSYLKHVWDYLKQGLHFAVIHKVARMPSQTFPTQSRALSALHVIKTT